MTPLPEVLAGLSTSGAPINQERSTQSRQLEQPKRRCEVEEIHVKYFLRLSSPMEGGHSRALFNASLNDVSGSLDGPPGSGL